MKLAKFLPRITVYSHLLPENPLHDDIYLVSFPRSGVTWSSVLMANIHLKCSGVNAKATFFNTDSFIPDIHQSRTLKANILTFPGFRIIKSHSKYNPFYKKLIYLIRDPRDVMVSYYDFVTKHLRYFNGSISEMLRSKSFGINEWCYHIEGWFEKTYPYQLINFIRYEDLKSDPKSVLDRIYTLLGYKLSDDIYDYAIQNSSFDEMRKDEEYYSEGNLTLSPDVRFLRKGVAGGYKAALTEDDIQFINRKSQRWLKIFGYEI